MFSCTFFRLCLTHYVSGDDLTFGCGSCGRKSADLSTSLGSLSLGWVTPRFPVWRCLLLRERTFEGGHGIAPEGVDAIGS